MRRRLLMAGTLLVAVVLACALPPQSFVQRPEPARKLVDNVWLSGAEPRKYPSESATALLTSLTPNDPAYDPAWGNVLEVPNMLGELQERMAAGLTPQTVYIAVMDGTIMSHPDLDPLHATQFDKDFTGTPPGDMTLGSHGTGVASIACARTNNGMGAASVAGFPGSVKFFSVRIFDVQGNTTLDAEVNGFNYVASLATQGVPVVAVACAFGGGTPSDAERDAIKAVTDKGVVVFAGALSGPFYPASYSDTNPMVVPVTSLTSDGTGVVGDDLGGKAIAAPTNVKVVVKQSQPDLAATFGGVSASTSQPAGTYALIRSLYPTLSPLAALRRLGFSTRALTGAMEGKLSPYLAITNRVLLVGSPIGSTHAVALDAITQTAEPFAVRTRYLTTSYGVNEPTRISFFAYNLSPTTPLSNVSVRTTDLNDANSKSLSVESVASFPDMPFLAAVTVLLRDDLAAAGDVRVRLMVNGIETDPVVVKIK